jgi:septum formation protein
MPEQLVLASGSRSRLRVLRLAGIDPEVVESGVDESFGDLDTAPAVALLAQRKARAISERRPGALVLGCDSMLDLEGTALGKPATAEEAKRMWSALAGKNATLLTGHCLVPGTAGSPEICEVGRTVVHFGRPSGQEVDAYVASGEPLGMAGAFSIDGLGAAFVDGIEGDAGNVLGVSLPLLRKMLASLGLRITDFWGRTDRPDGYS